MVYLPPSVLAFLEGFGAVAVTLGFLVVDLRFPNVLPTDEVSSPVKIKVNLVSVDLGEITDLPPLNLAFSRIQNFGWRQRSDHEIRWLSLAYLLPHHHHHRTQLGEFKVT